MVAPSGHPSGQGHGLPDVLGAQAAGVVGADHFWGSLMVGVRSAAGGSQWSGSAGTWSPVRMSSTSALPSGATNHTNGMPRLSAWAICLPNLSGLGATSQAMPRSRSRRAMSTDSARDDSSDSATSTTDGTERDAVSPSATSGTSRRDTPSEMPTPG